MTAASEIKAKPRKKAKSKRRKLYDLHTWVGFHLALIMFVVLLTGTIATVSNEIDWLIQPDMRVDPSGAETPGQAVSWTQMEEAIKDYDPDLTIGSIYTVAGDHFALRARTTDEFGRAIFTHVDQWTGEVTGRTHPMTVQRVFRDLHRYLFMPNVIGLPVVTSMAFILAISLYTGLKTSRNWRTLLFRVRTDKGARIMIGDAHKAAGLWSIWLITIMIVTGVWYLIEFGVNVGNRIAAPPPAVATATTKAPTEIAPTVRFKPMGDFIAASETAFPDLKPATIFMPNRPGATAGVQGHVGNPLIRVRANNVRINAVTGAVESVNKSRDMSTYRYINEMADPLHFGFFGGLPTKLLYFLFGIALTGLSASGVWLTWKRLKTKAPTRAQFATVPVMMLSMYFFVGWYDRQQGPDIPQFETPITNIASSVSITAELRLACMQDGAKLRARLSAGNAYVAIRQLELDVGETTLSSRTTHFGRTVSAYFDMPDKLPADGLSLIAPESGTVWTWSGLERQDASCKD
ncbi:MAG: PepSY-associated TM helix domain-containing protein [Pseudomonadota bacterium]